MPAIYCHQIELSQIIKFLYHTFLMFLSPTINISLPTILSFTVISTQVTFSYTQPITSNHSRVAYADVPRNPENPSARLSGHEMSQNRARAHTDRWRQHISSRATRIKTPATIRNRQVAPEYSTSCWCVQSLWWHRIRSAPESYTVDADDKCKAVKLFLVLLLLPSLELAARINKSVNQSACRHRRYANAMGEECRVLSLCVTAAPMTGQ